MSEDIKATEFIIQKQVNEGKIFMFGIPFDVYQKVYAGTNENIDGYMSQVNFNRKEKVLSVLASGDHVFNSVCYGITNIDTFDTNRLTEYYALGIKRSAILAFDYSNYLLFMKKILDDKTNINEINELIYLVMPYMEEKHKNYWKEIIEYNYNMQKNLLKPLNLFHMLLINLQETLQDTLKNTYLLNEDKYNELRNRLSQVNITFQNYECLELPNKIYRKYDFIFLSNIADYFYKKFGYFWEYDKLRKVENEFDNLLEEDGILFLAYLYKFCNVKKNSYNSHPIQNSNVSINDFVDEEIITFSYSNDEDKLHNIEEGMLLKKKCY